MSCYNDKASAQYIPGSAQGKNHNYDDNLKQALRLPKNERELLADRLKSELKEFRERERMYMAKR